MTIKMLNQLRAVINSPYIEKWYWGFLLQGAIVLGLAPILIPIIVGNSRGPLEAGVVVAAFYLGQLASPACGILADKLTWHKPLYLGSYILMGLSVMLFTSANSVIMWFSLALIIGLCAGAGNTISAMYIVEIKNHKEWDQRIGWLQTFYGTGQALGLFAAAAFATKASWGMLFAGALMLPGFLLSRRTIPAIQDNNISHTRHKHIPHNLPRHSYSLYSPFTHYQQLSIKTLHGLSKDFLNPFGLFLASWFTATFGMWMFMNLYPLLMQKSYSVATSTSSTYYAIFATAGAFAYAPSGKLGKILGNSIVVFAGMLMLLISLLGLTILCHYGKTEWSYLVPLAFAMIPIAWSPLIVSGTALASELTTLGQGAGLGIFNAVTALSSVLAALTAGSIAHHWDYPTITLVATILALIGSLTLIPLLKRTSTVEKSAPPKQHI